MPRFFNVSQEPVTFQVSPRRGGSGMPSYGRPQEPTDEQTKRSAVRNAKANAYVDAPRIADASAASPDASGMTLNMGSQEEYSQEKYYANLEKAGYPDFAQEEQRRAQELEQQNILTENKKLNHKLWVTDVAMRQVLAGGDPMGAMITANKHLPEEEQLTEPPRAIGKDKVFFRTKSTPDGQTVDINEWSAIQADAKDRMEGYFPTMFRREGDKLVGTQQHKLTGKENHVVTLDLGDANAKQSKAAGDLWGWYTGLQSTKSFSAIKEARYRGHAAAMEETASGDLVLMKTLARASEPEGRTITDADFLQIERAREIAARLGVSYETYKSILSGQGTLGRPDRQRFVNTIETLYHTKFAEQKELTDKAFYSRAKAEGIPENMIKPVEEFYKEPTGFKKYNAGEKKDQYPTKGPKVVETRKTKDGRTIELLEDGTKRFKS